MELYKNPDRKEWASLCERPVMESQKLEAIARDVLNDVRSNGDEALRHYTFEFDKVQLGELKVANEGLEKAGDRLPEDLKKAIDMAIQNIRVFHESQKQEPRVVETAPGVNCWQKSVPIEKVGLYVPGGTAPLFSTVLMLAIPASIAGCKEIVLCSPPGNEGAIHPAVLYAAWKTGVTAVFSIGGIQAIGAMAYGTDSVPAVYKIFGPGNQYVTVAKQLVARERVAIDLPAGPSEVAVMADSTADPVLVAIDLLSQAEHGGDSQVMLVTNDESVVADVQQELEKLLDALPRKQYAQQSVANSKAIVLDNEEQMICFINEYAPEHLIISMNNYAEIAEKIINAGSVFLGYNTPESAGDYTSGTNHTLPTNGFARVYSGVNLDAFVKKITFQELSDEGLKFLGDATEIMALTENLDAHAKAVRLRLDKLKK